MTTRRLATVASISVALAAAFSSSITGESPTEGETLTFQEIASGTWGLDIEGVGCNENPHTIEFSDDGAEMRLQYASGAGDGRPAEFTYDVIGEGPAFMRMTLRGETRTTESGETVIWELVLLSGDRYCWRRSDWSPGGCTPPATRCPDPTEDGKSTE